jgi:Sec-independent protein translocase protein TatA
MIKKFISWTVLITVLLFPILLLGYENLGTTPEDVGGFITWFTTNAKTLPGAGGLAITAFILTCLLGIFKLTPLRKYWDKLGKWKVVIPLVLGAVAELIINFPSPFTWQGLLTVFIAGVTGSGALAIAINQVWKKIFNK